MTVTTRDDATVVRVDGGLSADAVPDLERVVRRLQGAVVIDLSNLLTADDAGVATLRGLAGRGVRIVGASPYIALLMERREPGRGEPTSRS